MKSSVLKTVLSLIGKLFIKNFVVGVSESGYYITTGA